MNSSLTESKCAFFSCNTCNTAGQHTYNARQPALPSSASVDIGWAGPFADIYPPHPYVIESIKMEQRPVPLIVNHR